MFEATKDLFVGTRTVDVKWGVLEGPGRSVALPAPKEKDTVTMTMVGDKLMGTNSQLASTYELRFHQGADWFLPPVTVGPIDPASPSTYLDSEDLSIVVGCEPNNLLRLTASGTVPDPGSGRLVDFTLRLFVIHLDLMYGATEGSIGTMTARRLLVMSR